MILMILTSSCLLCCSADPRVQYVSLVFESVGEVSPGLASVSLTASMQFRDASGEPLVLRTYPKLANLQRFVPLWYNFSGTSGPFLRVSSSFFFELDWSEYPFDVQVVTLSIEPELCNASELVWKADRERSGIHSSIIAPPGFELDLERDFSIVEDETYSPLLDASFSRVTFQMKIHRRFGPILLTSFMPPIFIILSVITSFFLPPSLSATRYSLSGSALVSAVLFHAGLQNPANQIGKIDVFMVLIYALILVSLIVATVMVTYSERKEKVRVERLIVQTRATIILLAPWWFTFVFFDFWVALGISVIGPLCSVGLFFLGKIFFRRFRIWQRVRLFVSRMEGDSNPQEMFEIISPSVDPSDANPPGQEPSHPHQHRASATHPLSIYPLPQLPSLQYSDDDSADSFGDGMSSPTR